jgi:hypothetical protein
MEWQQVEAALWEVASGSDMLGFTAGIAPRAVAAVKARRKAALRGCHCDMCDITLAGKGHYAWRAIVSVSLGPRQD